MPDLPDPGLEHSESRDYQVRLSRPEFGASLRGRLHGLHSRTLRLRFPLATDAEKATIKTKSEQTRGLLTTTIDVDQVTLTGRIADLRFRAREGNRWDIELELELRPTT